MRVISAIPIQIPVHRIRVTARCLASGVGPVHTAVLRLADYWGDSPEEIAEVLGLPIPRVATLLDDLQRGGEPLEREFVVWVDHPRGRVLPYSALNGVAVKPNRYGPITLPVDPPTPSALKDMGLDAGISWDLGLEGRAEVLEVLDVVADVRDPASLPHVLRLPDTQLVIATADDPSAPLPYTCAIAQHGTIDPELTGWARSEYAEDLDRLAASPELEITDAQLGALAELTGGGEWQTLEPHPAILREQIYEALQSARERVVLAAPNLRAIPEWLGEALGEASERELQVVLCPAKTEHVPARAAFQFTTTPAPNPGQTLTVIADEAFALTHTDPAACLDRRAGPIRQHLYASRQKDTIGAVLDRLGLKHLRVRPPRGRLTPRQLTAMLRQALGELQDELPRALTARIEPEDEQFALETIDRQGSPENPTRAAHRAAAGIAWERIVATLAEHVAGEHAPLEIVAKRWLPPNARIDLDLILADDKKGVVWIIDAKNADPTNEQLHKMQTQMRLLKQAPELTEGRQIIAVIIHRKHQLKASPQPTEQNDILRSTLQHLPDLLLAKRVPGIRPRNADPHNDRS
jgi:hypothetical protein